MATLTGLNSIAASLSSYDGGRAYNVGFNQGWDGDVYFFEKFATWDGIDTVKNRIEIEGQSLGTLNETLYGTDHEILSGIVEKIRLLAIDRTVEGGPVYRTSSEIEGLTLDAASFQYNMLWTARGADTVRETLQRQIESSITTFFQVAPSGSDGWDFARVRDSFAPEQIYLSSGSNFTFYPVDRTGTIDVYGTAGNESATVVVRGGNPPPDFNEIPALNLNDDALRIGSSSLRLHQIDEIIVSGNGVGTIIGHETRNDKIQVNYNVYSREVWGGISRLEGRGGNDSLTGNGASEILIGGTGDDILDGGAGIDTGVFEGDQANYTLTLSPTAITLADRSANGEGTDQLTSIEFLDFGTEVPLFEGNPMNLDIFDGPTGLSAEEFGAIIELYIAYYNRAPDAIGLNYWGTEFSTGFTLPQMAENFFGQPETQAAYGSLLNDLGQLEITDRTKVEAFATEVYRNVLGRESDQEGLDYWIGELQNNLSITPDVFILAIINGAKNPSNPTAQTALDQDYLATKSDLGAYFAVIKGMSDLDDAAASLALFDAMDIAGSRDATIAAIDQHYADALDPVTGDFLMQLVGVIDDPFGI